MLFEAPDHRRYKIFTASLSPELQATQKVKSLPLRSGDTVRILRGDHKGFEGKITKVNRKKYRVNIEGLTREKVDGTAILVHIHPSKVMITSLNLDDKWRKKIIERKKVAEEKMEKTVGKPVKEIEAKEEITAEKTEEEKKQREEIPKTRKKKTTRKPKKGKIEKKTTEKAEKKAKAKKPRRKTAKKSEGES